MVGGLSTPREAEGAVHGGEDARGQGTQPYERPQARRMAASRATLLRAVTREDMAAVVQALIDKAKDGDVAAIREVLDRTVGKTGPAPADDYGGQGVVFQLCMPEARERID